MRIALKRTLAALLALMLLAALLSGCTGGGDKPPAQVTPSQVTPAVNPIDTPSTPAPDAPDAPTATPEPTSGLEPVTLADAVGVWELYSTEVEGDFNLAADTGSRSWLVVRDCARADFVEARDNFDLAEHLNCPITVEPGGLFLNIPDDEYGRECELVRADEYELELSFSFRYSDGTPGGSTHIFSRIQEPAARFTGVAVSPRELRELNERANTMAENGFFQTTFSRPQEIDWYDVLYNGADIDCEPSEDALAEYEHWEGELPDVPILAFTDTALREFVWEKTLTSYSEATNQLWSRWYESSDGYVLAAHGDTNYVPVEITEAYAFDEIYQLHYERADYANFVWEPVPFVMTLRIHDGQWQYISNERFGAGSAALLTVDYFDEKEDVPESMGVREFVDTPEDPSDEPSWKWAVLTAREDGVCYSVDRTAMDYDDADYFLVMYMDRYIGDNITSGVLDKGESVAVKVVTPWYPTIRVMASKDTLYGELWFGENGMLHIFDTAARRYVDGFDADALGRGCDPRSEDELMAFLSGEDWFYLDPVTYEPRAVLRFPYGHYCVLEWSDGHYEFTVWYFHDDADEEGVPEIVSLYRGYDDYTDWSVLPERFSSQDQLTDYRWTAYQLYGEQVLYLTQTGDEPGVLSYILPGADEDTTEFLFVRFTGTTLEEGQG